MKTKHQIIDECVSHIESNGRALDNLGLCSYLTPDSKRCGHSIFVKDEIINNLKPSEIGSSADGIIGIYTDSCHKEGYTGQDPSFWLDIQALHDKGIYWENNSLSVYGMDYVIFLKVKYNG